MRSQIRGREDIVADILETASSPIRQTVIMYRANLSWTNLIEVTLVEAMLMDAN